jgi:hypothetical protein
MIPVNIPHCVHVLNKGNGKRGRNGQKRCQLNETRHRAPRRKSWSVEVDSAERARTRMESGWSSVSTTAPTASARRSRAQPADAVPCLHFGRQLWLAAMPYLCHHKSRRPVISRISAMVYAMVSRTSVESTPRVTQNHSCEITHPVICDLECGTIAKVQTEVNILDHSTVLEHSTTDTG